MKNDKGFTLTELLAVIIVLSLLMVFAIPTINNSLKQSRISSFQIFAKKAVDAATVEIAKMDMDEGHDNEICFNINSDLNLDAENTYSGFIKYIYNEDEDIYKIYLSNGEYIINEKELKDTSDNFENNIIRSNKTFTGCTKIVNP